MGGRSFFFAGGATAGHIYPAVAVAEKIIKIEPDARIHFFVSERGIDSQILLKTDFRFSTLPARGFSLRLDKLIGFIGSFFKSARAAEKIISKSRDSVVIGVGGFVAAPVCQAANKLKIPIALINVDVVPGKANRIIARWAKEIFVQFEETAKWFSKTRAKVHIFGCPLRAGFEHPQPEKAIEQLGLDKNKKILLVIGGSSGAESINRSICYLLGKLGGFADGWRIVHITGAAHIKSVETEYAGAKISSRVLGYYDEMADLLSAADLVIGRSGAVSVAEYAAAGCPAICMPYPHHGDMQQYLNAGKLVEAGAAIIVDDAADEKDRAEWLWEELEPLLKDEGRRAQMAEACAKISKIDSASKIANRLLARGGSTSD